MPHFFISYAKKDTRDLAIALSDALNALPNVTAWVDRSLKAGASWETQIQREINKCNYFVVLYSPDLNRHLIDENLEESYVLTEIAYAKYTVKKPIIPVMAQTTNPPLSLTTAHYIDFTLKGLSLNDLLEAICDESGIQLQNNVSVGTVSIPSATPKSTTKLSVKDILPPPFDFSAVTAGEITLEGRKDSYIPEDTSKVFQVPAFLLGKYPITNAQFAKFIEAGGYKKEDYWTKEGWHSKTKHDWAEPRYWNDKSFNQAYCPVVGVSWYEALAFCAWLRSETGEKISLPNEMQWQRAAEGDSHRVYPWGNQFDRERANTRESDNKATTPVKNYPNGASPFAVWDMTGNVREWCLTHYSSGSNRLDGSNLLRVIRGGSWADYGEEVRCASRGHDLQVARNQMTGFRIALNLE